MMSLCTQISGELRAVDTMGLMPNNRIGVLLPATNFKGANSFSASLCEYSEEKLTFQVFTYPDHWIHYHEENDIAV